MFLVSMGFLVLSSSSVFAQASSEHFWDFQSIDTMKYSRDPSREFLSKMDELEAIVNTQVRQIKEVGATHVGIATPYDEEFLPILKRWVGAARRENLKVWFRGNFSGWEGWFGYEKITREQHKQLLASFITEHPDLFESGDLFSACPECENGGPGDPRINGDAAGHRKFLIDEYDMTQRLFREIGKNVQSNIHSMNGDVARLIMDQETTSRLGGIITVDHYVGSPQQLAADIEDFAKRGNGKVILGEFGAPIPDIHGEMTEKEQAKWIESSLNLLSQSPSLVGINYWVNVGGSTAIWTDTGEPKPAVEALHAFFKPNLAKGIVVNAFGKPIEDVRVYSSSRTTFSDKKGKFLLPFSGRMANLTFSHPKMKLQVVDVDSSNPENVRVVLDFESPTQFQRIRLLIHQFLQKGFGLK